MYKRKLASPVVIDLVGGASMPCFTRNIRTNFNNRGGGGGGKQNKETKSVKAS